MTAIGENGKVAVKRWLVTISLTAYKLKPAVTYLTDGGFSTQILRVSLDFYTQIAYNYSVISLTKSTAILCA